MYTLYTYHHIQAKFFSVTNDKIFFFFFPSKPQRMFTSHTEWGVFPTTFLGMCAVK
eukprot:NODE_3312_length_370_cov_32.679128_g3230_i0.p1 GENE.NODE_3312_length_370_cov_32.679128_g3230_i0~~NODE_3312_length_370_cov_32.679128_g3230_i0.p1  ORF type:complete len:56 (-),score=5.94 NODE_3312_length_370_cov_32.679128_g3230_i0:77-244(-)